MVLWHSVQESFLAVVRQWRRALLTMLGIVIGIAAVTGVVSVSEGLNGVVMDQLNRMGLGNSIVCWRDEWIQLPDGRWVRNRSNAYLTYEDALAIQMEAPSVAAVLPEVSAPMYAEFEGRSKTVQVVGTTPEYQTGHNWFVEEGRFLTDQDLEARAKVAVIGREIQDDLFRGVNPLGEWITVNGVRYRVVGLMKRKAANAPDFTGTNNTLILPLTTFQQYYMNRDIVWVFFVRANSALVVPQALLEVKAILGRRKQLPADAAFRFFTSDEVIRTVGQISFVLKGFLVGVASIALAVGSVGIMNMMLVTVTERTHEIGLRKALGANRFHILTQFSFRIGRSLRIGGAGRVRGRGRTGESGRGDHRRPDQPILLWRATD
ncbi:MAG: ABC transporter permease [Candidatus Poribacteria bacterium]|nr:MAG: ABC transporter permease [Candidatus Poribacteria bacterium]